FGTAAQDLAERLVHGDKTPGAVFEEDALPEVFHERVVASFTGAERLFHAFESADVPRYPEDADNAAVGIAEGHGSGRGPGHASVGPKLHLLLGHYRLTGAHDGLFVREEARGGLLREKVKVGLAENGPGAVEPEAPRHCLIGSQEAARR